ncbi:MAG: pilus assembly protein [Planctomycetaceae bacterium]|nr:pilus assembly protein [Planctomycetaceae bacterium]
MKRLRSKPIAPHKRNAVAAVEMAVSLPLLVLLLLGTIDLGQFMNVGQVVSNASRIGARKASVHRTKDISEVKAEVLNYLGYYFPNQSASTLSGATTVKVALENGTTLSGTDLTYVEDGVRVVVSVQFNYSAVRWIKGIPQLDSRALNVDTTIRRL